MPIVSDRNAYIAGHVTPETKKAVQEEAVKQSISVSKYLDIAIRKKLAEDGVLPTVDAADGPA